MPSLSFTFKTVCQTKTTLLGFLSLRLPMMLVLFWNRVYNKYEIYLSKKYTNHNTAYLFGFLTNMSFLFMYNLQLLTIKSAHAEKLNLISVLIHFYTLKSLNILQNS